MANEHQAPTVRSDNVYPFSTSVSLDPMGGWVTTIQLDGGASVSKWFEAEADAREYPSEIIAWLEERGSA